MVVELAGRIKPGDVLTSGIKLRDLDEILDESRSTPTTLDAIQQMVAEELQAILPEELINQLGFKGLEWYRFGPEEIPSNDLHIVFVGGQKGYDGGRSLPLRAALGTVAITRMVDCYHTVYTDGIRVSGISKDSLGITRIIGAAYTAKEGRNAHTVDVSITGREFPPQLYRPYSSLLSLPKRPFAAAGIYTEVMMGATRRKESGIHTEVLQGHDPAFMGYRLHLLGLGADHRGFAVSNTESHHKISRSGHQEKPWSVSVPRRLTPLRVAA